MPNLVPEGELKITATRSSGPGGQKVNKTSSKAVLRWNLMESAEFSDQEKQLIREVMANNLNSDDEVVMSERQSRSWHNNRERVIERLNKAVSKALTPKKKRIKTQKPRAADERRLSDKKRQGQKKTERSQRFTADD